MATQSFFRLFSNLSLLSKPKLLPLTQQPHFGLKKHVKETLENLKLPEKPKRPLTPFMRFLGANRKSLEANTGTKNTAELAKLGGQEWKKLDENIKQKYQEDFKKENVEYTKRMLEYESLLTEEQKSFLKLVMTEKTKDKKKRKLRKLWVETGKPKRPISGYLQFGLDYAKQKGTTPLKIPEEIKQHWNALPEVEKNKYTEQHKKALELYKTELQKWKDNMIAKGRTDIIPAMIATKKPSRFKIQKEVKE